MRSLERFKRLVRTSISGLAAGAADPELALADLADKIALARGEILAAIEAAEGRRRAFHDRLAELRRFEAECTAEAEQALADGDEDQVREALRRRQRLRKDAGDAEALVAEAEFALAGLRRDQADLEQKLKNIRLEQSRLALRLRQGETEQDAAGAMSGLTEPADTCGREEPQKSPRKDPGRKRRREDSAEPKPPYSEFEEELILEAEIEALKRRSRKTET
jgi:phage shock protein A